MDNEEIDLRPSVSLCDPRPSLSDMGALDVVAVKQQPVDDEQRFSIALTTPQHQVRVQLTLAFFTSGSCHLTAQVSHPHCPATCARLMLHPIWDTEGRVPPQLEVPFPASDSTLDDFKVLPFPKAGEQLKRVLTDRYGASCEEIKHWLNHLFEFAFEHYVSPFLHEHVNYVCIRQAAMHHLLFTM